MTNVEWQFNVLFAIRHSSFVISFVSIRVHPWLNKIMRRFSQRSHLVTLSEINITPLLDLAFVLLIIFIITTPLLTQSIELHLPNGGNPERHLKKSDIKTVEISSTGYYKFEARKTELPQIISQLVRDF